MSCAKRGEVNGVRPQRAEQGPLQGDATVLRDASAGGRNVHFRGRIPTLRAGPRSALRRPLHEPCDKVDRPESHAPKGLRNMSPSVLLAASGVGPTTPVGARLTSGLILRKRDQRGVLHHPASAV